MATLPISIAEDRSLRVVAGAVVKTEYVELDVCRLACKDRMAIGDVEVAYRRRLQLGKDQPWPCPVGQWEGDRFVIYDGRHDYIASLMLGYTSILVAWME